MSCARQGDMKWTEAFLSPDTSRMILFTLLANYDAEIALPMRARVITIARPHIPTCRVHAIQPATRGLSWTRHRHLASSALHHADKDDELSTTERLNSQKPPPGGRMSVNDLSKNRFWTVVAGLDPHNSWREREVWDVYTKEAQAAYASQRFDISSAWTNQTQAARDRARSTLVAAASKRTELKLFPGLCDEDLATYKLKWIHANLRNYWRTKLGEKELAWVGHDIHGRSKRGRKTGDESNIGRPKSPLWDGEESNERRRSFKKAKRENKESKYSR